jgi:hypothetical protein
LLWLRLVLLREELRDLDRRLDFDLDRDLEFESDELDLENRFDFRWRRDREFDLDRERRDDFSLPFRFESSTRVFNQKFPIGAYVYLSAVRNFSLKFCPGLCPVFHRPNPGLIFSSPPKLLIKKTLTD